MVNSFNLQNLLRRQLRVQRIAILEIAVSLPVLFFNGQHFESHDVQLQLHNGDVYDRCRLHVWPGLCGAESVGWMHMDDLLPAGDKNRSVVQIGPFDHRCFRSEVKGWRYQGSGEEFSDISEIAVFDDFEDGNRVVH